MPGTRRSSGSPKESSGKSKAKATTRAARDLRAERTPPTDREQFGAYFLAEHPLVAIRTFEEEHALAVLRDAAADAHREFWLWSCVDGLRPAIFEDSRAISDTESPSKAMQHLAHRLPSHTPHVIVMLDLADQLQAHINGSIETLRRLREVVRFFRRNGHTLVLLDHHEDLPSVISAEATWHDISLPDETELEQIVRKTVRRIHGSGRRLQVKLSRAELDVIVRNLRGLSRRQAEQVITDAVTEDAQLDVGDMNHIMARKRQMLRETGVLEFVETPVDLSEVGGLSRLKRWLRHRELALSPEAVEQGLTSPRGLLMLGVQGAGKSMCAKAIATAWKRPLLRLDPGALFDKYIGETERRLRQALHQAELMSPIVLWIDEIEKGFASAASTSNDGGVSRRMFGTLLTWMQEHAHPVFLVATANDIEALPPELLRKGRFDEIFFVDLPTRPVRRKIFEIHLKRRGKDPGAFDLDALANASDGYSGAEIEQAIVATLHESFAEDVDVDSELIIRTLAASPPLSVTMAERIRALRAWARGRCQPAD